MAIGEFNVFKDWDKVDWKPTLWLNFLRAVCVTPIFLAFTLSNPYSDNSSKLIAFLYPVVFFVMVPLLLLLRPLMFAILGPIANIFWIPLCFVMVCGGDPIVFIISKIKPDLVPIQGFNIINLVLFIFVTKNKNPENGSQQRVDSDY